jgi:hypothetical protein
VTLIAVMIVKDSVTTIAEITGREKDADTITLGDTEKVIETEQFLERLLGYRVHIHINVQGT